MKREFVINRHGKDYVLYAGLLDEAHQQGLKAIKTQLVQAPTAENGNVAICMAEVTTEKGTFTGIGDADPSNVNRMLTNALIRLAETRAKARALRDAVNVSMVAIEELVDGASETLSLEDVEGPAQGHAGVVSLASMRQGARAAAANGAGTAHAAHVPPAASSSSAARPAPPVRPAPAAQSAPPVPDEAPAAPARPPLTRSSARGAGTSATSASGENAPLPATQTQLETIAKLARSAGKDVSTEGLTRAAASELITRLSEERYGTRRGT
ncbi:MAG: hypothetical protein HY332_21135 [Chloroflexi bacterium]|nr:hypothetical protein [Chloroflexota bacterium]